MNSSFHPPIVLADEREKRARRQKPYPEICDHLPAASKAFEHPSNRGAGVACAGVVAFLFLIALAVWLVRYFLKG